MKKIRNIVVAIPTILFILAIILIFRISFSLKKGEVPKVFGFTFMVVQTKSMEPTVHQYDFIVNKTKKEYHEQDIVSFKYDIIGNDGVEESVTHRIINIADNGVITLKGDNVTTDRAEDYQVITSDKIIGKMVFKSTFIGKLFTGDSLLKNKNFIFALLIGSLVIFMIYQMFNISKIMKEQKAEEEQAKETKEESSEDLEEQIAKLQAKLKEKEQKDNNEENNE